VVGGSAARSSQRRACPGQSVVFSQLPEPRSDQTCSRYPYVACMESMNNTPSSGTAPHHPTVTPASSTGRKRPRHYESPVPAAYRYVYPPQHSSIVTNIPTCMIRSPPHWSQNCRPCPPAYYPAESSVYSAVPSPAFHSPYSPQSSSGGQTSNQPWVADVPPYTAAPTTGTNNEFDLFNGELLSPEREGAISPFVHPKRDSL
jgi:hypothetical protein